MSEEICIDGVPPSVTEDELKILFSECGIVQSVELVRSTDGNSLGIARMQLESPQAAENAVRLFHHARLDGWTLLVFRSRKDDENEQDFLLTE